MWSKGKSPDSGIEKIDLIEIPKQKQTNFERIKNMAIDEMADFLEKQTTICQYSGTHPECNECQICYMCICCNKITLKQWLESESE